MHITIDTRKGKTKYPNFHLTTGTA